MTIKFYKVNDEYGCFSNFAHYAFSVDGVLWNTSEHYFQAHKFDDENYFNKIRQVDSPMDAANLGRSRKVPLRSDWEEIKQNIEIQEVLLNTGDDEIVEATTNDYYWGCGSDGSGKNMLGKILMETRELLRKK